jgi:Quinohemoprotein amine dehydrogenase, alpha subunit domain III/IPT/TIG domain
VLRQSLLVRALVVIAFVGVVATAFHIVTASASTRSVVSVTPSGIGTGATRQVTIVGTGFKTNSTVSVSGAGVTVSGVVHVSSTTMRATLSASLTAAPGARTLHVVTDGVWNTSLPGGVHVGAHPALTSISPSVFAGSGTWRVVTLNGADFVSGAKVTISGTGFLTGAVTILSPTQATVPVSATVAAAVGLHTVKVTNPDQGSSASPALLVVNPLPLLSSVSLTTLNQGETTVATITGSNFSSGAKVYLGKGVTSTVLSVTPSSIIVQWSVNATAPFGQRTLTVVNADTGAVKMTNAVGVDYGAIFTKWAVGDGATGWVTTLRRPTFVATPALSFTGTGVSVTGESLNGANQLVVTFSVSPTAAATWRDMTITDGTTTWSVPRGLKIRLAPVVTSTTSLHQGATNRTITVKGANFEVCASSEPVVAISGGGVTITKITSVYGFLMYLKVSISPTAATGARDLTITNCDSGGSKTSTGIFTILP